eukprot:4545857-Prorocentrum_lima.AAC.1
MPLPWQVAVRKTRRHALRMLMGRRPPLGLCKATTRVVLSHSWASTRRCTRAPSIRSSCVGARVSSLAGAPQW